MDVLVFSPRVVNMAQLALIVTEQIAWLRLGVTA